MRSAVAGSAVASARNHPISFPKSVPAMTSDDKRDWICEEEDQLWFDTWEGQIELSTDSNFSAAAHRRIIIEDDFDLDFNPPSYIMDRRRSKSLLRQKSLPVFDNFDDFHSTHTLFWNNQDVSNVE